MNRIKEMYKRFFREIVLFCLLIFPLGALATTSPETSSAVKGFFDKNYEQFVLLSAFLSGLFVYPYFSSLGWWKKYWQKKTSG